MVRAITLAQALVAQQVPLIMCPHIHLEHLHHQDLEQGPLRQFRADSSTMGIHLHQTTRQSITTIVTMHIVITAMVQLHRLRLFLRPKQPNRLCHRL